MKNVIELNIWMKMGLKINKGVEGLYGNLSEANGPQGHFFKQTENEAIEEICGKSTWLGNFSRLADLGVVFFEKIKNPILDMAYRSVCTKFQVCIVFRLARSSRTTPHTHKPTDHHIYKWKWEYPDRLLASHGFKNSLDMSMRNICTKFQVSIVFCLITELGTDKSTNQTNRYKEHI